jgi:hypothetical protein
MLGHASTAITEQVYTSVFEDVEREAAESAAALFPRAHRAPTDARVPTCGQPGHPQPARGNETAGQDRWGCGGAVVGRVGLEPTTQG